MSQADVVSTQPLPPGVSEADLSRAIDAFTAALGADKVLTSDADLREFRDPFQYATWDAYTASAVVMPTRSRRSRTSCASPTSTRCRSGRTGPAATTATAARRRACAAR